MNRIEKKVERNAAISERRLLELAALPATELAQTDADAELIDADGVVLPMRANDFGLFWQQNQSLEKCAKRYQTSLDGFARDEGDCDGTIRHRCKSDKRPTRVEWRVGMLVWCCVVWV